MAEVNVRGLRELTLAFEAAGKQAKKELRDGFKDVAEPVQRDAESLARERIPKVGPTWSRMRIGVTRTLVYVAPRERGVKGRGTGGLRRPRFGTLLMERAMEPALERNEAQIARAMDTLMDEVGERFNRG